MRKNEKGYIDSDIFWGIGMLLMILVVIGLIFAAIFVRFQLSNSTTSGIAYNLSHNSFIDDNTHFSVRAGENTPVTEENQSTYCLPPNSEYKDLVSRAAADKRVKIVVTADKYFAVQAPWVCNPNVKVTEVKE